jgi:hypothetical protein
MTCYQFDVIYETKKAGVSAENKGQGRQSGSFDPAGRGPVA